MRPIFILTSLDTGAELSIQVIDRSTRVRFVDVEGVDSDTLEVDLDDRDARIHLPREGERLSLMMGYAGLHVEHMGDFVVDEVGISGPPAIMTISAKGVDLLSGIKAPRTESHHEMTIGTLARRIGERQGLRTLVHSSIANVPVPHVDQVGESDMALLTRLAEQHDLTLKLDAVRLTLRPHASRLPAGDLDLPAAVTLRAKQLSRHEWRGKSRTRYSAVRAWYYDIQQAARVAVTVGDAAGGPVLDLRHDARDAADATRQAQARLHQLSRGTGSLSLTLPGDPRLRSGGRVRVDGLRDPIGGVDWVIERAEHTQDRRGYVTHLDAVPTGGSTA